MKYSSKILSLFFFCFFGFQALRINPFKIPFFSFLSLTLSFLVLNSVFDILMLNSDWYGICRTNSLIFLIERLRRKGNFSSFSLILKNKSFLPILSLTALAILLINLKWEVPVKSINFYNENNLIKRNNFFSKFTVKINFDIMNVLYLKWFFDFLFEILRIFYKVERKIDKDSFFNSLLFFFREDFDLSRVVIFPDNKVISALLFFYFINFFSFWLSVYSMKLNPEKISDELLANGIYFNLTPFEKKTKVFLSKIVNLLIFSWVIIFLFLFLTFQKFIPKDNYSLDFYDWLLTILGLTDLLNQIIVKIRYNILY